MKFIKNVLASMIGGALGWGVIGGVAWLITRHDDKIRGEAVEEYKERDKMYSKFSIQEEKE